MFDGVIYRPFVIVTFLFVSVSTTTTVTLPTTTVKPCVFSKEDFVNNFGYEPAHVIGYVNKDNDDSVISESEKIYVGDSLDDGVIVIINGCSNWFVDKTIIFTETMKILSFKKFF